MALHDITQHETIGCIALHFCPSPGTAVHIRGLMVKFPKADDKVNELL